ncbi:uncharacterized protein LOC128960451 [Oppia nitens]|uniref:uncharacterized protein LOC128960451 n=1 Tax=Oppia nitens TaxID=1686743 RepID=UPI0023DBEC3A|nr:uncharacterized protein LOC128960451 [Oppia nitens]
MSYIKRFLEKLATIPVLMGTAYMLQTLDIYNTRHYGQQQRNWSWFRSTYMITTDNSSSSSSGGGDDNNDINPIWIRLKCFTNIALVIGSKKDEPKISFRNFGTCICVHTDDQLFLTNAHVVKGQEVMYVRLMPHNGLSAKRLALLSTVAADVLYVEYHNDLALIRLHYHPYNYAVYEAIKLCDREPQFGEQVAVYGHGGTLYTVYPGMIQESGSFGVPFDSIEIDLMPYTIDMPNIIHSAVSVAGCSGGPLIDTDANCIGSIFGSNYFRSYTTPSKRMISFLKRGRHYAEHEVLTRVTDRRNIYSMGTSSDRRLGLVLEKTGNRYTVRDLINKADTDIYVGEVITEVRGQPFLDIRQIRTALAELSTDNPEVILTVSTATEVTGVALNANLTGDELPLVF